MEIRNCVRSVSCCCLAGVCRLRMTYAAALMTWRSQPSYFATQRAEWTGFLTSCVAIPSPCSACTSAWPRRSVAVSLKTSWHHACLKTCSSQPTCGSAGSPSLLSTDVITCILYRSSTTTFPAFHSCKLTAWVHTFTPNFNTHLLYQTLRFCRNRTYGSQANSN